MEAEREPSESQEDQEGRTPPATGPAIVGIGPSKPQGGRPFTAEERDHIFQRREKAVELHARGYSYHAIGQALQIGWRTAFNDVTRHLEHTARYWNAAQNREKIAATLRLTIQRADEIHRKLAELTDPTSIDLKLKALATMHRATLQLMRLYGFAGDQVFLGDVNLTTGESLFGPSNEWVKDMDPERIKKMREKIIDLARAAQSKAVDASFTVEEAPADESAEPEP